MSVTNLNDRWGRAAMLVQEKPETAPRKFGFKQAKLPAAAAPAKVDPVDPELARKFTVKNVTASEKSGAAAAVENGVRSQWMDVTPAMAARWLKNNFRNRPMDGKVVDAYARDMANGVWVPTHQGIAFNDRDDLIDGQHRLAAVVKSRGGRTGSVRMMVTFGLRSKIEGSQMTTMDCVDRGRTRSVADQLKIQHGLKEGTQISQIAAALAGFCHESIRRPSVDQVLKIYHLFKPEMDYIIANRSRMPGLRSAGVLAGFVFAMASQTQPVHERPIAEMFVSIVWGDDVKEGRSLDAFPGVKQLHKFLTGKKAGLILASMNRAVADLTLQAIYMDVKGKGSDELKMDLAGRDFFRAANGIKAQQVSAMFELPKTE